MTGHLSALIPGQRSTKVPWQGNDAACDGVSHRLGAVSGKGRSVLLSLVVDGAPGLEAALAELWPDVPVQRCTVHKHRNLLGHAPRRLHDELTEDYRDMVYAETKAEIEHRRAPGRPEGPAGDQEHGRREQGGLASVPRRPRSQHQAVPHQTASRGTAPCRRRRRRRRLPRSPPARPGAVPAARHRHVDRGAPQPADHRALHPAAIRRLPAIENRPHDLWRQQR